MFGRSLVKLHTSSSTLAILPRPYLLKQEKQLHISNEYKKDKSNSMCVAVLMLLFKYVQFLLKEA